MGLGTDDDATADLAVIIDYQTEPVRTSSKGLVTVHKMRFAIEIHVLLTAAFLSHHPRLSIIVYLSPHG